MGWGGVTRIGVVRRGACLDVSAAGRGRGGAGGRHAVAYPSTPSLSGCSLGWAFYSPLPSGATNYAGVGLAATLFVFAFATAACATLVHMAREGGAGGGGGATAVKVANPATGAV